MAKQSDALFLLEVLIDKIIFVKSPCFSDKDFRTCVNIACPAVEPLEICDDDPGSCIAKSGGPFVKTFNRGKSCLFSLQEEDITKAMSKFPVQVTVYKSLPCGCLPTKIIMGEATIDMTKEFVAARNKFLAEPTNISYEALKDSFHIIGTDKTETGEILMFLRLSCFGKTIVTRFQGASGLPNLGAGGQPSIVDRSCFPGKEYQTTDDPCVCGVAQSANGPRESVLCKAPCKHGNQAYGICPPARDPYNSKPCEDADNPCYCSGSRPQIPQPMICRNMDQYCLHVPKGILPTLPFNEDLKENQTLKSKENFVKEESRNNFKTQSGLLHSEIINILDDYLPTYLGNFDMSEDIYQYKTYQSSSLASLNFKVNNVLSSDGLNFDSPKSYNGLLYYSQINDRSLPRGMFRQEDITVYMMMFDDPYRHRRRTSGTQATATLNKCLQVNTTFTANNNLEKPISFSENPTECVSSMAYRNEKYDLAEKLKHSEIYYCSKKRNYANNRDCMGMGSKIKPHKSSAEHDKPSKLKKISDEVDDKLEKRNNTSGKTVSIKENSFIKQCDGSIAYDSVKQEMIATVSHIQIGPKEPCPFYGTAPCQGPKCLVARGGLDDQAPVKVSTVTNPRRGVFELVIRRMTGAPLAKNELMLEWTPPPCRQSFCGTPYPTICSVPTCRRVKCPTYPCKPSKCFKKPCSLTCRPVPCRIRACGPTRCRPTSCRPSKCRPALCRAPPCQPKTRRVAPCHPASCVPSSCWHTPCMPPSCRATPCGPISCRSKIRPIYIMSARTAVTCKKCCRPCSPSPCGAAPCEPPCSTSHFCSQFCKSTPCLRPCPIGYKKPRKARSQPKIKAHRQRISPCHNQSRDFPVKSCRSGPCIGCCGTLRCPTRKCSSISRCAPRKCCSIFPFKPKCFKSSCSMFC